jgi:hypothetical protein
VRRRYDGGKEIGDTDYINSRYSLGLVWSEWTVLDVSWCFSGYDYLPAFIGIGILSRWPGICYSERTAVDGVEK